MIFCSVGAAASFCSLAGEGAEVVARLHAKLQELQAELPAGEWVLEINSQHDEGLDTSPGIAYGEEVVEIFSPVLGGYARFEWHPL